MVQVIGISSGKGGVGKTTVAVNLGIALSQFGKKVIIVDCNFSTPHLSHYLGTDGFDKTINDVLRDKADITEALYQYNGVMFVPASNKIEDLIDVDIGRLKKNIKKLSNPEMIDFVLLDSAPGLGREAVSVLDTSEKILFVTSPLEPSVEDVKRCVEVVKEMGKKEMSAILNMKTRKRSEYDERDVEKMAKIPVIGKIDYDQNVINSLIAKKPVIINKPHSPASVEFMELAAKIIGVKYKPSPMKKVFHLFDNIRSLIATQSKEEAFKKRK